MRAYLADVRAYVRLPKGSTLLYGAILAEMQGEDSDWKPDADDTAASSEDWDYDMGSPVAAAGGRLRAGSKRRRQGGAKASKAAGGKVASKRTNQ